MVTLVIDLCRFLILERHRRCITSNKNKYQSCLAFSSRFLRCAASPCLFKRSPNMGIIRTNTRIVLGVFLFGLVLAAMPLAASQGSFTITASPSSLTVGQGGQGTSAITTTVTGGFNSPISLSATGLPLGATATFNPNAIGSPGSGN